MTRDPRPRRPGASGRGTPGRQQEDLRLVGLLARSEAHQRRGGHLREMAHECDEAVMTIGRHPNRSGAES